MGKLMMRVGEVAEAIEAFRKCLEINPYNDLGTRCITQQPSSWETASEPLANPKKQLSNTGRF